MKNYINKFKYLLIAIFFIATSCNDFLDELPDSRTQIDSKEKIRKLLGSAYLSNNTYALVAELSTDNIADYGISNPYSSRFYEEAAYWRDITEVDNDDLKGLWSECYLAIANANQALDAIEKSDSKDELMPEKGEALVARAYLHFLLVNTFAQHYNKETSGTDLGVVYMEALETKLNPKYQRETVASIYEKIDRDLEAGLPLISDAIYTVPRFHFNKAAAYAFAARFNLYYENWAKAENYASLALGGDPLLRDWAGIAKLPRSSSVISKAYFDGKSNYMLQTASSRLGLIFGAYFSGARFNHTQHINNTETFYAPLPWSTSSVTGASFHVAPSVYPATNLDKVLLHKLPYLFEYTDPVAGIGNSKSVLATFYSEETLLVRAEAKILQNNLQGGLDDINLWAANFYKANNTQVTLSQVNDFYNNLDYSTAAANNQKKVLNPKFTVTAGEQENMIHYLLQCRRILTLHEGLRWFDIKRYGIEVNRLLYSPTGSISVAETLAPYDLRKALQLPQDVVTAGLTPNPR